MFPKAFRATPGGIPVTNSVGALTSQVVVVGNGWNDVVSLPQVKYVPENRLLLVADLKAIAAGAFEYPGWTSNITFQSKAISYEGRSAMDSWMEADDNVTGGVFTGYFGGYFDRNAVAGSPSIGVGLSGYNFLTATNTRTINFLAAGQFTTEISGANATIPTMKGMEMQAVTTYGAGTGNAVTTAYSAHVVDSYSGGLFTIGTLYGLKIENQTGGTTNYAFKTGTGLHEIGDTVYPGVDNSVSCGKSGQRWSAVWAANGTIQTSDARQKNDIKPSALGLDFINALRPISFKWNVGHNAVTYEPDGEEIVTSPRGVKSRRPKFKQVITPMPGTRTHWGLIAQEVKNAATAAGVDFGGYVKDDLKDPNSNEGLRYDELIAPLIAAVQQLSAKVARLEAQAASVGKSGVSVNKGK